MQGFASSQPTATQVLPQHIVPVAHPVWTQTSFRQLAVSQGPALAAHVAWTHVAPLWQPCAGSQRPPAPHTASMATCAQLPPEQLSVVQPTPSSQAIAAPGWQLPPPQASPTVHALPSSQLEALASWAHPTPVRQESVVHPLASSQAIVPAPVHVVPSQTSPKVHGSPSSQLPGLGVCRHAAAPTSQ